MSFHVVAAGGTAHCSVEASSLWKAWTRTVHHRAALPARRPVGRRRRLSSVWALPSWEFRQAAGALWLLISRFEAEHAVARSAPLRRGSSPLRPRGFAPLVNRLGPLGPVAPPARCPPAARRRPPQLFVERPAVRPRSLSPPRSPARFFRLLVAAIEPVLSPPDGGPHRPLPDLVVPASVTPPPRAASPPSLRAADPRPHAHPALLPGSRSARSTPRRPVGEVPPGHAAVAASGRARPRTGRRRSMRSSPASTQPSGPGEPAVVPLGELVPGGEGRRGRGPP